MHAPRILSLALALGGPVLGPVDEGDPFPSAEPESVGLASEALEALASFVAEQVANDDYVGAELLVIKDGKTVLHDAWGWRDRESEVPLEPNALFNVRSMTKPLVGTAAQMLIEEGRLALDDTAASLLGGFDGELASAITVAQLLEHRAGLKMSTLMEIPMASFPDLAALAAKIGENGPTDPPGARFRYSDDGTSVLGACVEAASGQDLAAFLEERVLDPLGMTDSTFDVTVEALRGRICKSYMGSPGGWIGQWDPAGDPLYPFLLGSQGLYCTARDYARFLSAWMNRGRFGDVRLLPAKAVRRALRPASGETGILTGMDGLEVRYGQMWTLYVDPTASRTRQLFAFGHSGSDGTYALACPELDLMAFCFTQSRGSSALLDFERELYRRILAPGELPPFEPTRAQLEELVGYYWDEDSDIFRELSIEGGRLVAELTGRARLKMRFTEPDHLTFDLAPTNRFEVARSEAGAVVGFDVDENGELVHWRRFEPGADLPPLDEILTKARVRERGRRLRELGGMRWRGTIARERPEMEGTWTSYSLPDGRHRHEIDTEAQAVRSIWDGQRAWRRIGDRPLEEITGKLAEQVRLEHPGFQALDWTELFDELRPIGLGHDDGRDVWLLQGRAAGTNPLTIGLDAETGRLIGHMRIAVVPGMGEIGVTTEFRDWRELDGLELSYLQVTRLASPRIGPMQLTTESIETGLELDEALFRAPDRD